MTAESANVPSQMVYEQRVYHARPGSLPSLLARFEDHVLGIWTVVIGESNLMLIYLLRWKSLAEREQRFTAFLSDPEWLKVRDETDKGGPLVVQTTNRILKLTSFSPII
jgi:hypothetical protein